MILAVLKGLFEWSYSVGIIISIIIIGIFLKIAWDTGYLDFIRWITKKDLNRRIQEKINEFDEAGVIVHELKEKLFAAEQNKNVKLLYEIVDELNRMKSRWVEYDKLYQKFVNLRKQNQEIINQYFKIEAEEIEKLFDKAILRLDTSHLKSELPKFEIELEKIIENKRKGY